MAMSVTIVLREGGEIRLGNPTGWLPRRLRIEVVPKNERRAIELHQDEIHELLAAIKAL